MHAYNSACNEVAEHISATHILSKAQLSKGLYRQLRANYGLGAQMAQSAIRTTVAKYKGILKKINLNQRCFNHFQRSFQEDFLPNIRMPIL